MYSFDWLSKRAKLSPDKTALVDLETDRKFTYKQFNERASAFASFILNKWNLNPGDRLAILAYNSSNYIEILYGCAKAGLILVCLNWRLAVPELEFILEDSTPRALIFDPDFSESAKKLSKFDFIKELMVLSEEESESIWKYEQSLAYNPDKIVEMLPRKYDETWHLFIYFRNNRKS